jgi:beta-carotene 3-hydroxylase
MAFCGAYIMIIIIKTMTVGLNVMMLFLFFYAIVSMSCFYLWNYEGIWYCLPIGLGIMAYGAAYFVVHDIFIHQRFKMFRKANNWYAKGVRRAHKIHHKSLGKGDSENFGMLIVPFKYFKR